ncbi:hypothetical protein CJF32_00003229 [Rutstroemia sp. NJR-2017a WRK4]|nr:hypothetical protein CJF32_00003229 [Rutstroemia sp. NJR-2017a WRK4]
MSSGNGTSALPQKQIRFVNNEGQPPAKRRRVNSACVNSYPFAFHSFLRLVFAYGRVKTTTKNQEANSSQLPVAEHAENARRDATANARFAQPAQITVMSVWDMQTGPRV